MGGGGKCFIIFHPAGLLLHLCIFHVYINVTGMTTYEYVRAQRVSPEPSQRESIGEDQGQSQSQSQSQAEQSRCECGIRSNKIRPSSSEEVSSVRK